MIFVYNDDETVKTIHQTQADGDISGLYRICKISGIYHDGRNFK